MIVFDARASVYDSPRRSQRARVAISARARKRDEINIARNDYSAEAMRRCRKTSTAMRRPIDEIHEPPRRQPPPCHAADFDASPRTPMMPTMPRMRDGSAISRFFRRASSACADCFRTYAAASRFSRPSLLKDAAFHDIRPQPAQRDRGLSNTLMRAPTATPRVANRSRRAMRRGAAGEHARRRPL